MQGFGKPKKMASFSKENGLANDNFLPSIENKNYSKINNFFIHFFLKKKIIILIILVMKCIILQNQKK